MSVPQLLLVVCHSVTCLAIVGLAMDKMRRVRNEEKPSLGRLAAYYLVVVGAFGYLIEPLAGMLPTLSDVMFEAGVAMYLLAEF
ncbi:hypothetical protein [Pseudoxanthomonas sp. UTMC 1351]|uniref:hypothetical protein n=1 Tax=Pseudoxanthomonas sp. UTMC 1351 TaxID=2695853 RepID=UPI0034CE0273